MSTVRAPLAAKLPLQFRHVVIERDRIDVKQRTAEFSFSSDIPIERWFWNETLSHRSGAMKTGRVETGAIPFLEDHNWDGEHRLGVVERIWTDGGKGWAKVRFSPNEPRAQIVFKDIEAGIRNAVSVGYTILEYEEREPENSDDLPEIIVNSWEVLEISSVSVPADSSVGFGRDHQKGGKLYAAQYRGLVRRNMESQSDSQLVAAPHNGNDKPPESAQTYTLEVVNERVKKRGKEIREMYAYGKTWGAEREAQEFIDGERSLQEFKDWIFAEKAKPAPTITGIGMNQREIKQFSIVKAIRELSDVSGPRVLTGIEAEASAAMAKLLKRETGGCFLPPELTIPRMTREQVAVPYPPPPWPTTATPGGGNLVQTEFLPLIEYLRVWTAVRQAGATMLTGLQGNVLIPKQTGPATAYWLIETGPVSFTDQLFTQIALIPRRLSAGTIYSRQLMIQSSPDIEGLVRSDLAEIMAAELDRTALWGTGINNTPTGIYPRTAGRRFEFGNLPLYNGYINGIVILDDEKVNITSGAWLMNPRSWGAGIGTPKFPTAGSTPVIDLTPFGGPSGGTIMGYPVYKTQQIPNVDRLPAPGIPGVPPNTGASYLPYPMFDSRVFFGSWNQLLIGSWAGYEVIVDPYTLAANAQVRVVVLQFADINVRYDEAFTASEDEGHAGFFPLLRTKGNGPTNGPRQEQPAPPHEEAPNLLRGNQGQAKGK
jgi:HK97 family phage major capsid protein